MSNYTFDFFNDDDSIKLEWVSDWAEEFAEDLSKHCVKKDGKIIFISGNIREVKKRFGKRNIKEEGFSSTQLRNFYNEFLRIRDLPLKSENEKLALIKLLKAKVKYKKTTTPQFRMIFVDFIQKLVEQIGKNLIRFEKSCLVMEAIVGFFPKK